MGNYPGVLVERAVVLESGTLDQFDRIGQFSS